MRQFSILVVTAFLGLGMNAHAKLKEGGKFPLPTLVKMNALDGANKITAKDLKGKVVLVDFWASWCGPCKEALPAYDKLYKKHAKNGFVVIGVNVDDKSQQGLDFLKEHPVSFKQAFDDSKKLVTDVGVVTMPTSYLIDKKGKIIEVHKGFRAGDEADLEKKILKAMK